MKKMMPVRRTQNWLPNIFDDFFSNEWVDKTNTTAPAVNIIESPKCYCVEVAAPGLTKDDFKVDLQNDNELLICMDKRSEHKEEDKKHTYLRREFSYSQFQQRMILPDNVDKEHIKASVENGMLTVEIPKCKKDEKRELSRSIAVK